MKEIWKQVIGFENFYVVSNLGRVKSLSRKMWNGKVYWSSKNLILKPYLNNRGYYEVSLRKNKKRKIMLIHRLVAIAFIPNPKNKKEVNHLKKRTNNNVKDLEWTTSKENMRHAFETKRIDHSGEKNGSAKLSVKDILEIRKEYTIKDNYTKIGIKYKVSYWTISLILNKKTWINV